MKDTIKKGTIIKITAGILAGVLIINGVLSALVTVSLTGREVVDSASAAENYLAGNTEYVSMDRLDRTKTLLSQVISRLRDDYEYHYDAASIAIGKEDYEAALKEIDSCLAIIGEEHAQYEELLTKKGCVLALLGRREEAETVLNEIIKIDESNSQAHLLLAELYLESGDAAASTEHLVRYAELEPEDKSQLPVIAELYYGQGSYEKAIEYGEKAITGGYEANMDLRNAVGLSRILTGDFEKGEKDFKSAIEAGEKVRTDSGEEPSYAIIPLAESYYYLGLCKIVREDYEGAIPEFTASIEMGNKTTLSYYNRAVCLLQKEDYQGCLDDMKKVIEINDEPEMVEIAKTIVEAIETGQTDIGQTKSI